MAFTLDQLEDWFSAAIMDRARGYQRDGRVHDLHATADGTRVIARVDGSAREPYDVHVEIARDRRGGLFFENSCTCPMDGDCKHVAAALLEVLERGWGGGRGARSFAAGEWLQRLAAARLPELGPADEPGLTEQLLYLLQPMPYVADAVEIRTVVARALKKGGYGKARRYDPVNALAHGPARFLDAADRAILREIALGERGRLAGEAGAALLERIVATGRAHWQHEVAPALARTEARRAAPEWQVDEQGRARLAWRTEPEASVLLPLAPPWYLDPETGACGPLETGLEPRLAGALAGAPVLEPEELPEVWDWLGRELGEARLPAPPQLAVDTELGYRPTPVIALYSQALAAAPARSGRVEPPRWIDGIRIAFAYGAERIAWHAQEPRLVSERLHDRVRRLPRNRAAETEALDRLEHAGAVPLTTREPGPLPRANQHDFGLWRADDWIGFVLETLPRLREQGWCIEFQDGFRYRLAQSEDWYAELDDASGTDWFGLALGVEVDGKPVNLLPCLVELIARLSAGSVGDWLAGLEAQRWVMVPLPDGRLLPLPAARLRAILAVLVELYDGEALNLRGALPLARSQVARLAELEAALGRVQWRGGERLRALAERLRAGPQPCAVPESFNARLRPYQQQGFEWLQFLREAGLNGVLADDMGLGKTVQTLAHLLAEKAAGRLDRPCLIVAPTSLMLNWREEAARFAPALRVLTLRGPDRAVRFGDIAAHDLVLTTYALLPRDREVLGSHAYHLLILDEAQAIKNPTAQAGIVARQLKARHRLCLTGTPMENHLGELWSLFDFLNPGLLGEARQFQRLFRKPIEQGADPETRARLARRVAPFLLRRTKEQVATDLPEKTEIVRTIDLAGPQRDLYEAIRLAMQEKVRAEIAAKGLARSHIVILEALLKLRQVCCDPRLVKLDSARQARASAKLELLMEMLSELIEEGRRVLLFSQFTAMLALIEKELDKAKLPYVKLTGQTEDRDTPVRRFQAGQVPLFLISLKAGGTGLNLTAADTVIHYDPWWNPAAEDQATDRAHRLGQDKPVFVYKLYTEGTVEEKIRALQVRKRALVEGVLGEGSATTPAWTDADLDELFAPLG